MTAVSYTLLIDNLPAAADLLGVVQRIEVEEHARLANMLRLELAIGVRQDGSGWNVIDDDTFPFLTPITLMVTAGTGLPEPLITGYVIETRTQFGQPGQSMLEVVAMDATVLMNLEERIRSWPNMADSDIATMIFGEYGFLPQVDSTQPTRQELEVTTIQRGTDMELLRRLAARNGYECYVETQPVTMLTEAHFHPPRLDQTSQQTLTVNMGEATNVTGFTASFDMLRPAVATAAGLAIGSQSDQSADISAVSWGELGRDSALNGSGGQQRRVLLSQTGLAETGELQTYAQAVTDRSAWAITAEGELNTVAYGGVLRAKRPVMVRGAGQRFSGTYYVDRVQHLITADSYLQHFSLRRNATGLTGSEVF